MLKRKDRLSQKYLYSLRMSFDLRVPNLNEPSPSMSRGRPDKSLIESSNKSKRQKLLIFAVPTTTIVIFMNLCCKIQNKTMLFMILKNYIVFNKTVLKFRRYKKFKNLKLTKCTSGWRAVIFGRK